jgi:hypothetical protein
LGFTAVANQTAERDRAGRNRRRSVMAKGQLRSTKEKKKPKAEWNKKKKGLPHAAPLGHSAEASSTGSLFAKKR